MNSELQTVQVDGSAHFVPTTGDGDFNELVKRDVRGEELSDEEYQWLEGDLEQWKASLLALLQSIDREFTRRKGWARNPKQKKEYAAWAQTNVKFKNDCLEALREVKVRIKEKNVSNDPGQTTTLREILGELKMIRLLLEAKP